VRYDRRPTLTTVVIRRRLTGTPDVQNKGPPQIELDRFICACVAVEKLSELYDRSGAGQATPLEVNRDEFLLAILRLP
jgi:hypothetical protein